MIELNYFSSVKTGIFRHLNLGGCRTWIEFVSLLTLIQANLRNILRCWFLDERIAPLKQSASRMQWQGLHHRLFIAICFNIFSTSFSCFFDKTRSAIKTYWISWGRLGVSSLFSLGEKQFKETREQKEHSNNLDTLTCSTAIEHCTTCLMMLKENRGSQEARRNKIPITSIRLIRANNLQFSASRH